MKNTEADHYPTCTFWYVLDKSAIIMLMRRMTPITRNAPYRKWTSVTEGLSTDSKGSKSTSPNKDQHRCCTIFHQLWIEKMPDFKIRAKSKHFVNYMKICWSKSLLYIKGYWEVKDTDICKEYMWFLSSIRVKKETQIYIDLQTIRRRIYSIQKKTLITRLSALLVRVIAKIDKVHSLTL